jgi:nitrogen fixation/metabolism regulation signal transduction histidine kinase
LGEELRFVQLVKPVPASLAENAEAIQQGWREYQELSLARTGLKQIFQITMAVTLLLTVFSAIAGSFLLAGWMTGPLSMLAAGTRAVAEGDFRPVKDYSGRDELGVLTQSFNAMTRQLEDARAQVERNQQELEQANARLASVLATMTAGVLVLDDGYRVSLANPGAERILSAQAENLIGQTLDALPRMGEISAPIVAAFDEYAAGSGSLKARAWQRQFALHSPSGQGVGAVEASLTLLVRGARLPSPLGGWLVVFDDVSDVVSAQRAVAWSEVARRMAHEIKNPLTPIRLAAERLQMRLADKLPPPEAELLARSARTIVDQVAALNLMVDEFRDYARLPAARLDSLDLNQLVQDVLSLYPALEAGGELQMTLGRSLPPILGDASQLRQVIHNLVKNAQEATDKQSARLIEVLTELVRRGAVVLGVRLIVRDNGPGFPSAALARIFEPYVSTKVKGTGLGLAIVRKIVEDHGALIDASNRTDEQGAVCGASLSLLFTKLAKSDDNRGAPTTLDPSRPIVVHSVGPAES